jgi:uncharacterized pyridoxamine 5'-phosphate oxidase family protein
MNKAFEFLKACMTFFVATTDKGQPRVRPFGAVCEYRGKVYFCTNNTKNVFRQIMEAPKIEICGVAPDGKWIRIEAEAVADPDRNAKAEMLKENPGLSSMYSLDDDIFEVLYLKNATASIYSFVSEPEVFSF